MLPASDRPTELGTLPRTTVRIAVVDRMTANPAAAICWRALVGTTATIDAGRPSEAQDIAVPAQRPSRQEQVSGTSRQPLGEVCLLFSYGRPSRKSTPQPSVRPRKTAYPTPRRLHLRRRSNGTPSTNVAARRERHHGSLSPHIPPPSAFLTSPASRSFSAISASSGLDELGHPLLERDLVFLLLGRADVAARGEREAGLLDRVEVGAGAEAQLVLVVARVRLCRASVVGAGDPRDLLVAELDLRAADLAGPAGGRR